jgi:hypothetical protein
MNRSFVLLFAFLSVASCHASCNEEPSHESANADAAVLGAPRGIEPRRGVMMRPVFRRDMLPVTNPSAAPSAQPH